MNDSVLPTTELGAVDGDYFVVRLDPDQELPIGPALSTTRTARELSIVCLESEIPAGATIDGPWSAFYTQGTIAFGTTGIVAGLVTPLADIQCPVFVVSTFDGDILMVPKNRRSDSIAALTIAGHRVVDTS